MAGPIFIDRAKELTNTTGTGMYTLAGAVTGFQSFAEVGNGNTCYYAVTDGTNWEVGLGTYTLSGTTLARTSISASSNGNAAVSWAAGSKSIWVDFPASFATLLATTTGSGAYVLATGATIANPVAITGVPTPTNPQDAANKAYADAIAAGIHPVVASKYATTAALAANTYNNGASGVGATLTANANGALSVDGAAVSVGNTLLIKDEVTQANNGLYTVTATGDGSNPYILTRINSFDSPGEMTAGSASFVSAGTTNIGSSFALLSTISSVGTTAVVWTQINTSSASVVVGATAVASGTSGRVLYNNAGVLGELTNTGSGNNVLATSPTLIAPALGTPSAAILTNATGLPLTTGVVGVLPTDSGGVAYVADITALASVDTTKNTLAYVTGTNQQWPFEWNSSDLSTKVSADPSKFIYVPPVSVPTGVSGAWVRIFDGPVSPEWAGIVPATTTIIQSAIDTLNALGGGEVALNDMYDYVWASVITLKNKVTLNGNWAKCTPNANIQLIRVNEGGRLRNFKADCLSANVGVPYTAKAISFYPTQNTRGAQWPQPWADGVQIEFDIGGGGEGLVWEASSFYIQETFADHISVYGGAIAMHGVGSSNVLHYCNGNTVAHLNSHQTTTTILEDYGQVGVVTGNQYVDIFTDFAASGEIKLGGLSVVTGLLWDGVLITFQGDENLIVSPNAIISVDQVTDNGRSNKIITAKQEYYDHRGYSKYGDQRNSRYSGSPGKIEFKDFIVGGKLSDKWIYSGVGSPVAIAYGTISSGTGNYNLSRPKANLQTSGTINDTAQITFGTADIKTGNFPNMHVTMQTGSNDTDQTHRIGFWSSGSNNVMFESDIPNARWICTITIGGSATTQFLSANFNRLMNLSIICSNDKVTFELGNPAFAGTATGEGRFGMTNTVDFTTPSQIPKNVFMAPLLYVRTNSNAARSLVIYDVQVDRAYATKIV